MPLGLVAGYRSGWVSESIMRVTDVFLALPQLILALALAQLMTPSLETAMIALALTYWPFFTRLVYAETRRLQAVAVCRRAARHRRRRRPRILFLHILPNAVSPIIVRATIGMGFTILVAAVLGFLGMGATPPAPDWGLTIAESRNYLPGAWWYSIFPGLAILITVLGFNLLGDGLARPRRSAPQALAMNGAGPILDSPRPQAVDPHRRGHRAHPRPYRFRAEPGHILGVVGESGCGKSTVIRAMLGILPHGVQVEAGEIRFAGENLLALGEAELNRRIRGSRIGFVPQDPYLALNPVFKIGAQLLEIMRWHAPGGSAGRAPRPHLSALLRRVQLPDPEAALERYPHQFSGGQRQRLLIAAALACSPALVIADEPTTALDVTTQQQILDCCATWSREFGLSMLFVTHDLGVVAELCDDICVIYAGQSVEAGPTAAVLAAPKHPYTRALLACHPDRARSFVGIPGAVPSPLRAAAGLPLRAALRRSATGVRRAPAASDRAARRSPGRLRAVRRAGERRRMIASRRLPIRSNCAT